MGVYIPNIQKVHSRACYRIQDNKSENSIPLYLHEYHNADHDFILWSITPHECEVVVLPEEHGRLIDADELYRIIENHIINWGEDYEIWDVLDDVAAATTVIEREVI